MSDYFERIRAIDEWDGVSPFTPIDWEGSFACPVCGGQVQGPEDMWQDCPHCGWEDDPLQRREPDYQGGPNAGISLNQAKENVRRCGFAIPSRHGREIQALIEQGKLLKAYDYRCEVCQGQMPGYFDKGEQCPTCAWEGNYAGHRLKPDTRTNQGTLAEARERYRRTGRAVRG